MRGPALVVTIGAVAWLICLAIAPPMALAGTTGTVTGRVVDQDGKPVVAATILIVGTRLGAYSDTEGHFTILNVAPGTYEVKASRIGFNADDDRGRDRLGGPRPAPGIQDGRHQP